MKTTCFFFLLSPCTKAFFFRFGVFRNHSHFFFHVFKCKLDFLPHYLFLYTRCSLVVVCLCGFERFHHTKFWSIHFWLFSHNHPSSRQNDFLVIHFDNVPFYLELGTMLAIRALVTSVSGSSSDRFFFIQLFMLHVFTYLISVHTQFVVWVNQRKCILFSLFISSTRPDIVYMEL